MKLNCDLQNQLKKSVAKKAVEFVKEGMLIGLGTGSTTAFFIDSLIEKCRAGLKIKAVASSLHSSEKAKAGGIPLLSMDAVNRIDLTIDSADEIDSKLRCIKGGGGALLREKIIASTSKKVIIIADESKLVPMLGKFGLPIEILPFGYHATIAKIHSAGYEGSLRTKDGLPYLTDNGNFIYDIQKTEGFIEPEKDHKVLIQFPGVVETGFFISSLLGLVSLQILVAYKNGNIDFIT
ncbi:MAG: ribose-5-phosphate isomerase RpiA [Chlamydiales bacterium]